MFRSYLFTCLFLSLLLIFGGCAKKIESEVKDSPAPAITDTADKQPAAENIPVAPSSVEAIIKLNDVKLETIFFDFESYALTTKAQQLLQANARLLIDNPAVKFIIEGHCDERGSDDYNLALGAQRALTAKNYLIELGVNPERLAVISYGEERPASTGHDESAWAQNRRIEFR
jgi:peptidoglycan-associated lipoprotein